MSNLTLVLFRFIFLNFCVESLQTLDMDLYCDVQKISHRIVQLQMTQIELDPKTQGDELRRCQRKLQELHEKLTRKEKERARSSIRTGIVFSRPILN